LYLLAKSGSNFRLAYFQACGKSLNSGKIFVFTLCRPDLQFVINCPQADI
jgi:hypothetical protein